MMKKVLVIGDWTIDQNWICGIQRSSLSSRTGVTHLRGVNEQDGATESLCGAGSVASIINRANRGDESLGYGVAGVGLWHQKDEFYINDMIRLAERRHRQPSSQYVRGIDNDIHERNSIDDSIEFHMRITDVPYIREKHHELNPNIFNRESIGSLSNCMACHITAEKGVYQDDNVRIPK